jgi:RNA ligase (TIGR02306 family)
MTVKTIHAHSCPVVRIGKHAKHPNADTLRIWNGPQGPVIFREGQFNEGDLAAFVVLDSLVDVSRPEFSFLKDGEKAQVRVRPVRLRGIPSVGLLVACPPGLSEGDDAGVALGVAKWEPPQTHSFGTSSNAETPPGDVVGLSEYDVENVWNIDNFSEFGVKEGNEPLTHNSVIGWDLTEKIHGCNARFTFSDGRWHCGSKRRWVKHDGSNVWSVALNQILAGPHAEVFKDIAEHHVIFGEVFGKVQDLHYGIPNGVSFLAFDLYSKSNNKFLDSDTIFGEYFFDLPSLCVTEIQYVRGKLSDAVEVARDQIAKNGKTRIEKADNIIEGIVIRPRFFDYYVNARRGPARLLVKVINPAYLQRQNGTEFTE